VRRCLGILALALVLGSPLGPLGCAGLLPALAQLASGASWLGSLVSVADAGQQAYFLRHPNIERQAKVDAALRRARGALADLTGAIAAGESLGKGDRDKAKADALAAYADLRGTLDDLGVLSAEPPLGGAETEAPKPVPFALPSPNDIADRL
jgi:hypothetical protein